MVEYYPYKRLRVDEELADTDQGEDSDEEERYPTDLKKNLTHDIGRKGSPITDIVSSGSDSDTGEEEEEQETEVPVDSTEAT